MNSTIGQILRTYCDQNQMNWADLIPSVMMAIRMSPNTESTGFSPYHMIFGKEMNIPFDISMLPKDNMSKSAKEHLHQLIDHLKIVKEVCKQNLQKSQEKSKQYYDKRSKEPDFRTGDRVLLQCMKVPKGLSRKLHPKWIGPYYITNDKPYEDPRNVREPVRRINNDINDNNSQNDDSIDIDKNDDEIQLPNNVDDENLEQDKQNDTDKNDHTQSETDDDSDFLAEKLVAKKKRNGKNYYSVKWVGYKKTTWVAEEDIGEVTALPVPVNTSLHATQLMDAPEYLALSNDKKTYLSLTSQQVMKCKNYNNNMYCPLLQSFSVSEDSCLVSIFNNDKHKVQSLCDFRFLHSKITPKIMYLKSSAIVVYKIPQISVDCSGKQIIHQGCDFCIMNIPCQCSIATKLLNYPPSITSCKRSNNITVVHPINLALLQQFFTSKQLTEINGSSTFVEKMNINVPDFKIYNHSYSSFLVKDQKEHLSLKKMAKVAKKERVISQDLTEPLLDGQIDIERAKLEELANIAYQRLHTVQEPKIVYIMAGIPDICIKSKAPAYEESFYNLDDSNKLLSVQNILIQTRTKLESINCKVVFVTITTMSFHDWNIHRLRCHKISKLIYLNQYVDMQNKLNSVLHQLNKFITASNEDNNVVTPFLHTYVHKIMGKRHYDSYSKLVDGVHPSAALAEKWRKYFKRIMKINERILFE
ncbi:unnamed protein product [Mytilus coruscus]|uniref:Chromo domain-containing protein n=1 Tax=Mytilus coruscus TaxID=42192 RepID=A0A6J8EF31_MYTCO|nr:unnamed protein product [Mytilus coruscus]